MLSTIRHDSIFQRNKALPATIIGVGATGSRVFASLVELGAKDLTLIDPDVVEPHNLANQIFSVSDLGQYKTQACLNWGRWKLGTSFDTSTIKTITARAPSPAVEPLTGVVFLLTDTMSSRHDIGKWMCQQYGVQRVIETRMASSYGDVYAFDPLDYGATEAWFKTLTDDAIAETSACGSGISVGPTASVLANLAVWEYIKFCMGTGDYTGPQLYHHNKFHLAPWGEMTHNILKEAS
jgi:molybdopterin/thiamine biosynthesis adenylyltransferase